MTHHRGIPTTRFRSRIEARWAAFFDLMGWPWEYEPLDLAGYVPDFVLTIGSGPGLLVEVKGEMTMEELAANRPKIEGSGWAGEAMIVGGRLFEDDGAAVLGVLFGDSFGMAGHDVAIVGVCGACGKRLPSARDGSWHCRGCGARKPDAVDLAEVRAVWRAAGNAVQWRKS